MSHIFDSDVTFQHGGAQVAECSDHANQDAGDDRDPPAACPQRWIRAGENHECACHGEQYRSDQSFHGLLRGDSWGQLMLAEPCTGKQPAGIAQSGKKHNHDGVGHRMAVERQRQSDE